MEAILTVHPLFSDHAVLPREAPLPVHGRAVPGQTVKISLAGQQATARTDGAGRWEATLEPLAPGGPHTLSLSTAAKQLIRRDILIGDVWLASGQSNMEWPLEQAIGGVESIPPAGLPRLRLFGVPRRGALEPQPECEAHWVECTRRSAAAFSAIGLHFGRTLLSGLEIPIGVINASWGGTTALAWTPAEFIRGRRELGALAEPLARVRRLVDTPLVEACTDTGNQGEGLGWARTEFPDAAAPEIPLPGMWQASGMAFNGAVWFRRPLELPDEWVGESLQLELGAIDDFDTTYFNGVKVGGVGPENLAAYRTPRRYPVPAKLVRPGRNVIAVRVFDQGGLGGFCGPAAAMRVFPVGRPHDAIPLAGLWRVIIERPIPLPTAVSPLRPDEMAAEAYPSGLFNGMIAPLVRFPIRGAIWYQGESDVDRAQLYRSIFVNLISGWRAVWGRGDFPFLFVQLANYMARRDEPGEDAWAELREAQTLALRLPATGMAVAADVGDADDIHPREKRVVGERLALAALSLAYGRSMPSSGPLYANHAVEGGAIRVRFSHAGGGLRARGDGALRGFAIAGADRHFRWAQARIEGATVVVTHPEIPAPVAVRYGWEANPPLSLENGAGLPASPFRTDDWPGITAGRV